MNEHQSKLDAGRIQFHQWCEPPLEPGDYTVDVTHAVAELRDAPFTSRFKFSVAGPRFSLDPSEIYCVYPPKGQVGDFANSLPHVVFTRRTLPWERSLDPAAGRKKGDTRPWMALLVFSASDFHEGACPEVKSRSIEELLTPKEADTIGPAFSKEKDLAAYESVNDLCNTIDIPGDLFRQVAPSIEDLAHLAHVREVNTGAKETLSFLADGWFSVVLANRFPEPRQPSSAEAGDPSAGGDQPLAVENRAYLVSLEGMTDYLPRGNKETPEKNIRLAVLASWGFHCEEAFTFKASMEKLDIKRLCVPGDEAKTSAGAEKQVYEAFQRGYTALNHHLRNGEKTVSWYRGPLVPLCLRKETKYEFRPAADALLRYNPLDGMMDVTYAAAFQLGRLLGLQDRHFTTALFAYRTGVHRQINQALGRERVRRALGLSTVDKTPGDETESEIMRTCLKTLSGETSGPPPQEKTGTGTGDDAFSRDKETHELRLTTDFDLAIPKTVCDWLARLILLYRVPFPYLVPDERMLPPESMRFFYLDPGWLKCLLEGACSVGRSSSRDELADEYLRDKFLDVATEKALEVRRRTSEEGSHASERIQWKPERAKSPDWPLTGFLLRSPVVEGWQGLEMRAWKESVEADENLLDPLRIDRLAPDIMLCIFNGEVKRIEIRQPPEGMHFGAAPGPNGGYTRFHLRWLARNADGSKAPGDQLDDSETAIPVRKDGSRVVEVARLASDLERKLDERTARDTKEAFTSADFGVEMVESPGRVVFDEAYKETP